MRTIFSTLPAIATKLSGDSLYRTVRLYIILFLFYVRVRGGGQVSWETQLQYKQSCFSLRLETLIDVDILEEVFVTERYQWELPHPVNTIIDLGAHAGETALYYHACYPQATIYAVEPDVTNYDRLVKNCASIPNIIPLQVAVAGVDGIADFHVTKSSMGNSLRTRSSTVETVPVKTVTMTSLLVKCGIQLADLIKFDIEGAEEELFKVGSPGQYSRAYVGEFHGDLTTQTIVEFQEPFADFDVTLTTPFANLDRCMFWAHR